MKLAIAFEDAALLLVEKPQGLATTPGQLPSLCEAVFAERPELEAVSGFKDGEGGLLNRLDNDTGGLVLFAKTNRAFLFYAEAMHADQIRKTYLAVVHGVPDEQAGSIAFAIGHSAKSHKRMLVADGKNALHSAALPAFTAWRLIASQPPFSLLELEITKGVRHQIRVHLATAGWPIVGDRLYNKSGSEALVRHQLLYGSGVRFNTMEGEEKIVTAEAPFRETWRDLTIKP